VGHVTHWCEWKADGEEPKDKGTEDVQEAGFSTRWGVGEIGKIILHCVILFQLKKCREVGVSKKGAGAEIEG